MFRLRLVPQRFCALALIFAASPAAAAVCFVDAHASGGNDGAAWASAYQNLQTALANGACTEVWVAKAVYVPSSNSSFNIAAGKAVYGGFAGTENQRSQRDPVANLTVLSGDVDGNDCGGSGCPNGVATDTTQIAGINAALVVVIDGTGAPIAADTVLDGFTISAGDGNSGSGLFCDAEGAGSTCNPTLSNLVFSGNRAIYVGGALLCLAEPGGECSPALNRVTFVGNTAGGQGGAVYNAGGSGATSSPHLTDVEFRDNSAGDWGGAMYDDGLNGSSSPILDKVLFVGNSAVYGGALYNEGSGGSSSPALTNVTFSANTASRGGAMLNDAQDGGSASPTVTQSTFAGNVASSYGGAIYSYGVGGTSNPVLTNVILWDNSATLGSPVAIGSATIAYAIVEGGCPAGTVCSHLVAGDPRLGPLRDNGGFTRTLHPGIGSAAVNSADDGACPEHDQRGIHRPQGPHCDLGAVEVDRIFGDGFDGPA